MKKLFGNIRKLLQHELLTGENPDTRTLLRKLRHVKRRGYFTKPEFMMMCDWKSPRRRPYYDQNSTERVKAISRRVFATSCECERIALLDSLEGVGIPVASAILMLTDPDVYGVIDTRVWQILYLYGEVDSNPKGTALSTLDWLDYLSKLRPWASEFGVGVRSIERSLFEHHKKIQKGNLYN